MAVTRRLPGDRLTWAQSTRAFVRVYSHAKRAAFDLKDIVSCTTHKPMNSPVGGFSISVKGSGLGLRDVRQDDWVDILIDPGDPTIGRRRVMRGLVDQVTRSKSRGQKGAPHYAINIIGRCWAKIIVKMPLVFDNAIGPIVEEIFGKTELAKYTMHSSAGLARPDELIRFYLQRYTSPALQFVHPVSRLAPYEFFDRDLPEIKQTDGEMAIIAHMNYGGSLWELLNQSSHTLLNELWFDTSSNPDLSEEKVFRVVHREYPFSPDARRDLPTVTLYSSETITEQIGYSESDIRNIWRIHTDFNGQVSGDVAVVGRLGLFDPESAKKHGFCRQEEVSNFIGLDGVRVGIENKLRQWNDKLAEWHYKNDDLLSGYVECRSRPDIQIGVNVRFVDSGSGEEILFYCEGVDHAVPTPATGVTKLLLTRGVLGGVAALPQPISVAKRAGQIQSIEGTSILEEEVGPAISVGAA